MMSLLERHPDRDHVATLQLGQKCVAERVRRFAHRPIDANHRRVARNADRASERRKSCHRMDCPVQGGPNQLGHASIEDDDGPLAATHV